MENVYEFHDTNAIEEEAVAWLIKLDSDLPLAPEEKARFRQWLNRSPAHRKTMERYSTYWSEDSVLAELAIPLRKPQQRNRKHTFNFFFTSFWPTAGVAATAALLVLGFYLTLGAGLFKSVEVARNGIYSTAIGEQQTQTLADGSILQLNTDTSVRVDYSHAVRKIHLLRGEAHFDVVPDSERPFDVRVGDRIVRAVGTAFSVYLTNDNIKVTVNEGKVGLAALSLSRQDKSGASVTVQKPEPELLGTLVAGQSALVREAIDEISNLAEPELMAEMSWRSGVLAFADEPLSNVIAEINRYTPITIEIVDPALNDIRIGGRFKIQELEGIFDVLEVNFGIEVARLDAQHIQLRSAENTL
jgi:transmembrane sensor